MNTSSRCFRPSLVLSALVLLALGLVAPQVEVFSGGVKEFNSGIKWEEPKVVDPGPIGGPPSDAVVLFDGKDLSKWKGGDKWIIQDGYAISANGDISTKDAFGDCQLHIEWAAPAEVKG